ncbi:hypothetical protein HU200_065460 [Digitaria exilis]|uniref:Uncharacterized protein n=1 Tax=Digitaria exilis TaxID=1010633 RepID=A0A835A086_9POAL|nr:hypothetical protein HU200_065460 [Digitaria exilis]
MAENLKPVALLILLLNLCMYIILAIIGGWALNVSIDRGFIIGPELRLPAHFHPIFFPIGNFATGFFVLFSLVAGVVGIASAMVGFTHLRFWNYHSMKPAVALGLFFYVLAIHGGSHGPVPVERRGNLA